MHLRLAHGAADATRWTAAGEHLAAAARLMAASPDPALTAEATVLEAEVALASGDLVRSTYSAGAELPRADRPLW